jgi:hypothetical protein
MSSKHGRADLLKREGEKEGGGVDMGKPIYRHIRELINPC